MMGFLNQLAALGGFIIAYSGGFSWAFYLWDKVIF